jgi:hypothetical protein
MARAATATRGSEQKPERIQTRTMARERGAGWPQGGKPVSAPVTRAASARTPEGNLTLVSDNDPHTVFQTIQMPVRTMQRRQPEKAMKP